MLGTTLDTRRAHEMSLGQRLAALGAVLTLGLAGPTQAGQRCAGLIVATPAPDGRSAVIDVVVGDSATTNTNPVATPDQAIHAMAMASGASGQIYVVDPEADPTGSGTDPNGGRGRGGVYALNEATGDFALVSDGTLHDPSIPSCSPAGIFVDPSDIAFNSLSNTLLIVDANADPSGLGADRGGASGYGALFSTVCSTTGSVSLVADGSDYPAGIPDGRPSIFENPVAAAIGWDGDMYLVDRSVLLNAHGGVGAVFRIAADGEVALVAAEPDFRSLRDIAIAPNGHLMVLDDTDSGRVFEIDPNLACGENTVQRVTCSSFVSPTALAVSGSGETYVLDAAADPLGLGKQGAIFELQANAMASVVSSSLDLAQPSAFALLSPVSLNEAAPESASPGEMVTVWLNGGPFDDSSVPDFGEGIDVIGTHVLTSSTLEVELVVGADITPGVRDIVVRNSRNTEAFHCDLFEVSGGSFCATTAPVAATLRVGHERVAGESFLHLAWAAPEDPCLDTFAAYRSFTPVPSGGGGTWPVDPFFIDLRPAELDGSLRDPKGTFHPVHGRTEFFLVVPVGTNGQLGPLGHY